MNNPFDELEEKLRFPVMAISAAGWTKTPEEVDDLTEASADDDLNEWQYLEIYDSAGMRFVARRAYRGWPQGILAAFICRLLDHVVHVALELDDGTAVSVDELRRKLMALGEFEEDFRTAASHRDLIEAS